MKISSFVCILVLTVFMFGYCQDVFAQDEDEAPAAKAISLGAGAQHPAKNIADPSAEKPKFDAQAFRDETLNLEEQEEVIFATKRDFGLKKQDGKKPKKAKFNGQLHPKNHDQKSQKPE